MKNSAETGQRSNVLPQEHDGLRDHSTAAHLALEVMHEIRNPLEALGHLTYLAHAEADDPEKVRKYMRLAEEQMATLNHIASQTLSFARPTPTPKPVNLVGLMEAALRIHQRSVDTKKIHLVRDLPEQLVGEVYSGELLQVISNLIANALDALSAEGTLCIRLRKRRDLIHLVVADNGRGIAPHHVEEIFKPFFTTREETGTGLGLALSRKIIDHHQGKICVRSSVRPGRTGTTFRISLPA